MADLDATLVQDILDVSEREWKPDVHHNGQADDVGAGLEVAEGGELNHGGRLPGPLPRLKTGCSDRAFPSMDQSWISDPCSRIFNVKRCRIFSFNAEAGSVAMLRDTLQENLMLKITLPADRAEPDMAAVASAFGISVNDLEDDIHIGSISRWFEVGEGDEDNKPHQIFASQKLGIRVDVDEHGTLKSVRL